MPAGAGDADNSSFVSMIQNQSGSEGEKLSAEEAKQAVQV